MSPWKILQIPRSADTREIKRAYAKQLKLTKPDEKPAEFQILYEAYKAALAAAASQRNTLHNHDEQINGGDHSNAISLSENFDAQHNNSEDDNLFNTATVEHEAYSYDAQIEQRSDSSAPADSSSSDNSFANPEIITDEISTSATEPLDSPQETQLESIVVHEQKASEASSTNDQDRQQEYDNLISAVENMLSGNKVSEDEMDWRFLASSQYLLDEDFNWYLGRHVFKLFAVYGQTRMRRARGHYYNRYVPLSIVHYCDQLFSWRNNANYFVQEFGMDYCRALLDQLSEEYVTNALTQGVRGGKVIRAAETSRPRPTQQETSGSNEFNYWHIIIIIFVIAKILAFALHK